MACYIILQPLQKKQQQKKMKIQAAKNAVDWAKLYDKKKDTLWLHFTAKALEEFYEDDRNWWESEDYINLHWNFNGNVTVVGKLSSSGSQTITHYCPIDDKYDINDFKLGNPCFMTNSMFKLCIEVFHDLINFL